MAQRFKVYVLVSQSKYFNVAGLDADVKARVEEFIEKIGRDGLRLLVEIDLNMTEALCSNLLLDCTC